MITIDSTLPDNAVERLTEMAPDESVRRVACEVLVERGLHGALTDAAIAWVYETTRDPAVRKVAATTLNSRGPAALHLIGMHPSNLSALAFMGR